MAPPPPVLQRGTVFKTDGGKDDKAKAELDEMVKKAESCERGVRAILLGPPGSGKGTQVVLSFKTENNKNTLFFLKTISSSNLEISFLTLICLLFRLLLLLLLY